MSESQNFDASGLDEIATNVTARADGAFEAILGKRGAMDQTGLRDKTLFVLLGEDHGACTDGLYQMALLNRLSGTETVEVGYELDHDRLEKTCLAEMGVRPDAAMRARLREEDRAGAASVRCLLGFHDDIAQANHTLITLFRFLLDKKIPTHLTDAVHVSNNILDPLDPSTAASLQACFGNAATRIRFNTRRGMRIRNHHMASALRAQAEAGQPRIIFQICGDSHILGGGLPAKESVPGQLKAAGETILMLPVLLTRKRPTGKDLPREDFHVAAKRRSVYALYDPATDEPGGDAADFYSRTDEALFLSPMLRRLGLYEYNLPTRDYLQKREQYRQDTLRLYDACRTPIPMR